MKQWATKQMKGELFTSKTGILMGAGLVLLIALMIGAFNGIRNEMRVHPVSNAAQALEAQENDWLAELKYAEKQHLGTLTLETAAQGEVTFMMGGVVGSVPGMTRTYEDDYQLWALRAEDFIALCFSQAQEIPDAGQLRMNSSIEWLKEEERDELIKTFSEDGFPAYVFLLEEINPTRWAVLGFCAAAALFCGAAAAYLLLSKKALRLTKLWKAMAKAGDPEKIREEMDEPLHDRIGFAVSTNYICVSGRVIVREGTECVLRKDDAGDDQLLFRCANGWEIEYYPDEDELDTLRSLLKIAS